jgi:outer membrane lipoprotein-sorting protein
MPSHKVRLRRRIKEKRRVKMKKLGLLLVIMVAIVSLLVIGCGGGGEETGATATPASTPKATSTATSTPTKTTATGDTLSDLLAKGQNIGSVKYDMVVTAPGQDPMTTKAWLKGKKMKFQSEVEGEISISIIDGDKEVMYVYMPEQNMAYKMDFSNAPESAVEETEDIMDYDYEILGKETLDGKSCLVVQWTVEGITSKMWVWEDKGFPIKMETTTSEGKTTVEYKNIQFVNISDSEFEIPAGVQIISF